MPRPGGRWCNYGHSGFSPISFLEGERIMTALTRASRELFRRGPDEQFETFDALARHCQEQKDESQERWHAPAALKAQTAMSGLVLSAGGDGAFTLTDWSFGQLCSLAKVSKETVNRLSPETAGRVFQETLPQGRKPVQIFTRDEEVRAIHGTGYTRLHDADLLTMLREFATDFVPPQQAAKGGTGLYAGEQDMFCFLIDPTGWAEISGEAFAPGFFLWNSEVGKRSVGVQTFWFQAVCANHIVWDAVEVVEFTRKHTTSVHESFSQIRRIIESLVHTRDARRDGFVRVIKSAMETTLGADAEEAMKALAAAGINRTLAKHALELARERGRFTVFSVVDALTRLSGELRYAGERTNADQKASSLLALVENPPSRVHTNSLSAALAPVA